VSACAKSLIVVGVVSVLAGSALAVTEDWGAPKDKYVLHAAHESRFSIEPDGLLGRVAVFTVFAGDRVRNWSGERTEVVLGGTSAQFRVSGNEGLEYYRIAVKLSKDWKAPEPDALGRTWGIFLQLHGPDTYAAPPAVALSVEERFCLALHGGDVDFNRVTRHCFHHSNLNPGQWVELVLEIRWSSNNDGAVAVYRRDQGLETWDKTLEVSAVPTLQRRGVKAPAAHYWKAGLYRSAGAWRNTLSLGPITRGANWAAVSQ
jgi:hypothetical protein